MRSTHKNWSNINNNLNKLKIKKKSKMKTSTIIIYLTMITVYMTFYHKILKKLKII